MKTGIFKEEIQYIESEQIRQLAEQAIDALPDYFFTVAASSTGKYHPQYALGVGGLVRHTKAVAFFAKTMLELEMYDAFTQREKDLIVLAAILHDGWKQGDGKSGFTTPTHPTVCADWIRNTVFFENTLSPEEINYLSGMVATHMGQWNINRGKEILQKPTTKEQRFLHVCDYLASRKRVEVIFEEKEAEPAFDVMTYTLTFGKHKGKTIETILNEERSYLEWLIGGNNNHINRDIMKEIRRITLEKR